MRSIDQNDSIGISMDENENYIGGITVTKVIKEHTPITNGQGSNTIGELVDKQLAQIAANGEVVQDITVNLEAEQWERGVGRIYQDFAGQLGITASRKRK